MQFLASRRPLFQYRILHTDMYALRLYMYIPYSTSLDSSWLVNCLVRLEPLQETDCRALQRNRNICTTEVRYLRILKPIDPISIAVAWPQLL